MDKEQEAMERLMLFIEDKYIDINEYDDEEEFKIIKVAIENYRIIKQFDKVLYFNASGLCVNGITYEQLEKALDKACELNIKQRFDKDYLYIPNDVIKQKEKELKDELLKESEQDENYNVR